MGVLVGAMIGARLSVLAALSCFAQPALAGPVDECHFIPEPVDFVVVVKSARVTGYRKGQGDGGLGFEGTLHLTGIKCLAQPEGQACPKKLSISFADIDDGGCAPLSGVHKGENRQFRAFILRRDPSGHWGVWGAGAKAEEFGEPGR